MLALLVLPRLTIGLPYGGLGGTNTGRGSYTWRWLVLPRTGRYRARYSPTALAAFSQNREPSRMYRRSIAVPLWPVVVAMMRSGTPAAPAEVARPARSE